MMRMSSALLVGWLLVPTTGCIQVEDRPPAAALGPALGAACRRLGHAGFLKKNLEKLKAADQVFSLGLSLET